LKKARLFSEELAHGGNQRFDALAERLIRGAGFTGQAVDVQGFIGEPGYGVVGVGDFECEVVNLALGIAPKVALFLAVEAFFGAHALGWWCLNRL